MRHHFPASELHAGWTINQLCSAAGLATVSRHSAAHTLADVRTGQTVGSLHAGEAGRLATALCRLRGL